jgi:arylsulfatase A-like enzyme
VALAAAVLLQCRGEAPAPGLVSPRPNFLLLSIDTLRADHLGCYGYERDTSPNLDRFAADGIRYIEALAPAPSTLPSHVGLLTGRHPRDVGIHDLKSSIPEGVPMLAEALAAAGYQTAAFVDSTPGAYVGAERGFGRGFDHYAHAPHAKGLRDPYDFAETVRVAARWLESRDPSRPFFLFLHTKSVHTTPLDSPALARSDAPYNKPKAYRARFLPTGEMRFRWREGDLRAVEYLNLVNKRIAAGELHPADFPRAKLEEVVALYDAGIFYVDEHFGRLVEDLRALGLEGDTIVVVTADHGEGFLDHLFFLHTELRPPLLRVPLILRDPRIPGGRVVERRVSLQDVAPTILKLADLPVLEGATGRPLPLDDSAPNERRELLSYSDVRPDGYHRAFALQQGDWKLLLHAAGRGAPLRADLYHTGSDPEERRPVEGEEARKQALLDRLLERIAASGGAEQSHIELDDETIESLRALGYIENR